MLFILLLLSVFLELQATEECNFVECVSNVRSYIYDLSLGKGPFVCRKVTNSSSCSEHCMRRYFPNALSHAKEDQISFTSFCNENISNRRNVNWSCIAKHTYRLFACFANVNSLTTNNLREEVLRSESCRKYLEFQNCPKQILLNDCGKESSDVVKDLILYVLDNYQPVSCNGANVKDVLAMPIHYQLGNDYVEAAKYLDAHHLQVLRCLTQKIQDEVDLDGYMCGDYDPGMDDCINFALSKNGKPYPDVNRLLVNVISLADFKCKQSSFEPKIINVSESYKPNDDHSSKVDAVPSLPETSTSKITKNEGKLHHYNLKLTTDFYPNHPTHEKTETDEKFGIPIQDSSDINVSDNASENTKRHVNQNDNSLNVCAKMSLSVHTLILHFILLLFIFR